MTRKISGSNFTGIETAFLCVFGSGGGGSEITRLYGLSEVGIWDPKCMVFELFTCMSENIKNLTLNHIGLK